MSNEPKQNILSRAMQKAYDFANSGFGLLFLLGLFLFNWVLPVLVCVLAYDEGIFGIAVVVIIFVQSYRIYDLNQRFEQMRRDLQEHFNLWI